MIVFITSIRHPDNCTSYNKVILLLERTLMSVCNQSDTNYKVIVVCNRLPTIKYDKQYIEFVKVEFPAPSQINNARTENSAVLKDKGSKYIIGLIAAKKHNPDYIMFFDADDMIHRDLAKVANSNKNKNGWFIEKGYVYEDGGMLVSKVDNFHLSCGTSHIIAYKLLPVPGELSLTSSVEDILDEVDEYYLFRVLGGHREITAYYKKINYPLMCFPFRAAIWLANTGENHSGVGFFGFPRFVSSKIQKDFGFSVQHHAYLYLRTFFSSYPYLILRSILRNLKHRLISA